MARQIKASMDEAYPGAWHCIVGSNFAAYVTHESGSLLYLSIGSILVFLYKHG